MYRTEAGGYNKLVGGRITYYHSPQEEKLGKDFRFLETHMYSIAPRVFFGRNLLVVG